MTTVVWGSTRNPVASQRLAALIEQNFLDEGVLYIGDVPLSFHPAATRVLGLVTPRSVG